MSLSLRTAASSTAFAALRIALGASAAQKDARVTQVVRQVNLLPEEAKARPAAINDKVTEGTSVRTGDAARSELTFTDLTITRLGANSIFSFNKAGRELQIDSGSLLLRVPKNSGGATILTSAVTAGITGTTVIIETARSGRSRLLVLEGASRLSLNKHRDQVKIVRAGQALDVPANATTLPDPYNIDLNETMKKHPLLAEFPPLPSQDLIVAAAREQQNREPVYPGQPVAGGSIRTGGGGLRIPPGLFPNPIANPGGRGRTNPGGQKADPSDQTSEGSSQRGPRQSPTPTPSKKRPKDPNAG